MQLAVAKGDIAASSTPKDHRQGFGLSDLLDFAGERTILRGEELTRVFARFHRGRRAAKELAELVPFEPEQIRLWARARLEGRNPPPGTSDLRRHVLEAGRRAKALLLEVEDGEAAYLEIYHHNLRLPSKLAAKYARAASTLTFEDLMQEGLASLAEAIERYDPSTGNTFATYAYWWVLQSLQRALDMQDRAVRKYDENHKRTVPVPVLQLDMPIEEGGDTTLADFLADETADPTVPGEQRLLKEKILRILKRIGRVHGLVLALSTGFLDDRPRSIAELAAGTGFTRDRIRNLLYEAQERFRYFAEREGLAVYLE